MTPLRAFRAFSLGAVAVVSAFNVVEMASRVRPAAIDPPPSMANSALRQEARFAGLLKSVQSRHLTGVVGYLAPFSGTRLLDDAGPAEDYFRAQFALVPLVLDPDTSKSEWAVTNFRGAGAKQVALKDWRILEDFGDGVLLLHRLNP